MSNDARNCATGCTSLGRHLSSCDSPDDQCRGCMPREAVDGLLCARCWGNLQRDVRTAPSIVDWIREHVIPSGQQALMQESTVKIRGPRTDSEGAFYIGLASPGHSAEGREPLHASAVDDADELHAELASWALLILEQHPSALNPRRPIGQRRNHAGEVVGIMPDSDATTSVCKFLVTHLEWAAEQEWIGDMVTEIGKLVRTFLARYPQAERSRYLQDVRCPACERTSMTYTPPAWAGQDTLVQCDHHACGCIVPEKNFGLFMAMIAEDKKRELSA
jgi:hypothetical protein